MSTVEQLEEQQEAPVKTEESAVLRYWAFVHAGEGAGDCEQRQTGKCVESGHYHVICRLPNQFQHKAIREKALAAKARRRRQMELDGSDSNEILESSLDELRHAQGAKENLVEELLAQKRYLSVIAARADLLEEDEWETIEQDMARFSELEMKPAEERAGEEYDELANRVSKWGQALQVATDKREAPRRVALEGLELDELIGEIRKQRIENEANRDFTDTYSLWMWFTGTLKVDPDGRHGQRYYDSADELANEDPTVVEQLARTFTALEDAVNQGNS